MITDCLSSIELAYRSMDDTVPFKDGVEHLSENDSPPRIVWGRISERFVAPDPRWLPAVSVSRCLHLREVTIEAHLWGAIRDDVETMLQRFIWSVRSTVGTAYRLMGADWPQGPEKLVQLGVICVLPITFLVPLVVPDGEELVATIQDTDTTDTALPFGEPPPFGE
jgi:hypothetical protein